MAEMNEKFEALKDTAEALGEKTEETMKTAAEAIGETFVEAGQAAKEKVLEIKETAAETVEELKNEAEEIAEELKAGAEEAAEELQEEAGEFLEELGEQEDTAEEAVEETEEAAETVKEVKKEAVKKAAKPQNETASAQKEEKKSGKKKSKYVSNTAKMWTRIGIAALLIVVLAIVGVKVLGNPKSPILTNKTVVTVDGVQVPADEYSYYVGYMVDSYAAYYGYYYFADDETFSYILSYVNDVLKQHYVAYNWALEEGCDLTEEELTEIDNEIEEIKASFESEEAFEEALKSSHLTVDLYRRMMISDKVITKFSETVYVDTNGKYAPADEDVERLGEEHGILSAKHILLQYSEDVEENEAILAKANELLEQIQNGADFDELMLEYSEDPGSQSDPQGYTFVEGEMVDEFFEATKALKVGEVSGIVESDYGYHIIKRVEPDFDTMKLKLTSLAIDELFEERYEKAELKLGTGYESIKFSDFNLIPETTEETESVTE